MARSQSQGVRVTGCPSFWMVVVPLAPVIVTCCSRFCTEPCGTVFTTLHRTGMSHSYPPKLQGAGSPDAPAGSLPRLTSESWTQFGFAVWLSDAGGNCVK